MIVVFVSPLSTPLLAQAAESDGIITTIAGGNGSGYSGDGGPATGAQLDSPWGMAVDSTGNVYIAEWYNAAIRKVDTVGVITTFAGGNGSGYSGDGGPATAAQLAPTDVVVDSTGNVFISDMGNFAIRKVDTAGVITTFAGGNGFGYSGDGGPATAAQLSWPYGVAVDSTGNVYIADASNNAIRKVDTAGVITTFAGGNGSGYSGDGGPATAAQLYEPRSVAVDGAGNVFISDKGNYAIRKVDTAGVITTFAGGNGSYCTLGGGLASAAQLLPDGVAVDDAGNVYISEGNCAMVLKVDPTGNVSLVAGGNGSGYSGDGGPATAARLIWPWDTAIDNAGDLLIADGNLYLDDGRNAAIRKVTYSTPPDVTAEGCLHYINTFTDGDGDGIPEPHEVPVIGADIQLWDHDPTPGGDDLVATAALGADGCFSLTTPNVDIDNGGGPLDLSVTYLTHAAQYGVANADGGLYTYASPIVNAAGAAIVDFGTKVDPNVAWNILDLLRRGYLFFAFAGQSQLGYVQLRWPSADGSTGYLPGTGIIDLGLESENYQHVILHEYGHFVLEQLTGQQAPSSCVVEHDIAKSHPAGAACAFQEGFADFAAIAVAGPIWDFGRGKTYDFTNLPHKFATGDQSEARIAAALRDLAWDDYTLSTVPHILDAVRGRPTTFYDWWQYFVTLAWADGAYQRVDLVNDYLEKNTIDYQSHIDRLTPKKCWEGCVVSITGTHFMDIMPENGYVVWGDTTAPVLSWSDSEILVTVPVSTIEKALVRVHTHAGLGSPATFMYR
jgi:hypothetical protein